MAKRIFIETFVTRGGVEPFIALAMAEGGGFRHGSWSRGVQSYADRAKQVAARMAHEDCGPGRRGSIPRAGINRAGGSTGIDTGGCGIESQRAHRFARTRCQSRRSRNPRHKSSSHAMSRVTR